MAMFKVGQEVTRIKTGEPVTVTEVLPLNRMVFYRIRCADGTVAMVAENQLRARVALAA